MAESGMWLSASGPSYSDLGGKAPVTHWIGCGLDVRAKRKIRALAGDQTLTFQSVASHDTNLHILT